jgi:hypothetical protein
MHPTTSNTLQSVSIPALIIGLIVIELCASRCVPALPPQCGPECTLLPVIFGTSPATSPGTITVNPTSGLTTNESGGTASFTIVLDSEPTANVSIALSSSATGEGLPSPTTTSFTPTTWNIPQTITVTGVNDAAVDGNQNYLIATAPAVSGDPRYSGVDAADVSLMNQDNDSPNVLITQSGGTTTSTEGGAGDSYTIVLATQPTANVTVTVTPDAQVTANASAAPVPLTFTTGACPGPGNWCTAQTVTVAAVDDATVEGAHNGVFSHVAASGDAAYNGIAIGNVSTAITDNDANPRIFVTAATHDGGFDTNATLSGGSFTATNSDGNGVPEADNFCDTDANNPSPGTGAFRALIVDNVNRIASLTGNAGDGQANWVLAANRSYVRIDGTTPIFTTNANRIFVFGALTNSTGTAAIDYWTGLNPDWTTSARHCTNWTVNAGGPNQGEKARANVTDDTALSGASGNRQCNQVYHLLCVEQ